MLFQFVIFCYFKSVLLIYCFGIFDFVVFVFVGF